MAACPNWWPRLSTGRWPLLFVAVAAFLTGGAFVIAAGQQQSEGLVGKALRLSFAAAAVPPTAESSPHALPPPAMPPAALHEGAHTGHGAAAAVGAAAAEGLNVQVERFPGGEPRQPGRRQRLIRQLYGLAGAEGSEARLGPRPDSLAYLDLLEDEDLAPFTKLTQRWIYKMQHPDPSTCSQQQFIVMGEDLNSSLNGLGSCIHIAGWELSMALQTGRQLVYHSDFGKQFVDPGCGRGEQHSNMLCLLEPPSSCGLEHATEGNSRSVVREGHESFRKAHLEGLSFQDDCPPHLAKRLADHFATLGIRISKPFLRYWWRAQSTAYIARLNAVTLKQVAQLRMRPDAVTRLAHNGRPDSRPMQLFPLPPGTIHVHVRHGLKGKEMDVLQLEDCLAAAEHSLVNTNPLRYKKMAFIGSDDPSVFRQAANATRFTRNEASPDQNWALFASNDPRLDKSLVEWTEDLAAFGHSKQILHHLLNLYMALECDAWVGTRGSNWARLIDELRCVWVAKCRQPYLEMGPPRNWGFYRWR